MNIEDQADVVTSFFYSAFKISLDQNMIDKIMYFETPFKNLDEIKQFCSETPPKDLQLTHPLLDEYIRSILSVNIDEFF